MTITTASAAAGSVPASVRGARSRVLLVLAAVVALLFVAGCGSDSSPSSDAASPSALTVPADFPTADVPLIDGALLSAGGSADEGWNLTVQGSATTAAALDAAVRKLTDAGYGVAQRTTDGGNQVVVLTATKSGKTLTVEVGSVAGAAGGPNSVFYQVSTT